MANRDKGEVSLTVGEASYTLKQSFNGMIAAEDASEEALGRRLKWDEITAAVNDGDLKTLRLFLWALLQKYHPTLTQEMVGALIDDAGGIGALGAKLGEAVLAAAPDTADVQALGPPRNGRPRKARANGTGGSSTSLPVVSA